MGLVPTRDRARRLRGAAARPPRTRRDSRPAWPGRGRMRSPWSGPRSWREVRAVSAGWWTSRRMTSATTSRRSCGVIGLARKSIAPSFIAATASGMLPWAVSITTGVQSPLGPEATEGLHAVQLRHPQVQHDEVARRHAKMTQGPDPVRGLADLVAGGFQRGPQHEPHIRLVVDDQDAFRWEHVNGPPEIGRVARIAAGREGERERRPLARLAARRRSGRHER